MEESSQTKKFRPFIDELKFNSIVKNRLDTISSELESAESSEDIINTLTHGSESGEISYRNSIGLLVATIAIIFVGLALYSMYIDTLFSDAVNTTFLVTGLIATCVYFIYTWKERKRKKLIERIFTQYEEKKYGFKYSTNQSNIDFHENVSLFDSAVKRGGHSNKIVNFASGNLQYNDKDIEYTLVHYKNMHRHVETRRKQTYTTDHIYNLYGVFISDIKFPAFFISTSKDSKFYDIPWTTSDSSFNERFVVFAKNEIEVARLFQPRNILWFEKVLETMPYESQKVVKSGNEKHRKYEYSCLTHTDLITSDEYPSLFWVLNINFFERTWDSNRKLQTTNQLAESLKSVELKGFEKFRDNINLLLERAV